MGYVSAWNEEKRKEAVNAYMHYTRVQKCEHKQTVSLLSRQYNRHIDTIERWIVKYILLLDTMHGKKAPKKQNRAK